MAALFGFVAIHLPPEFEAGRADLDRCVQGHLGRNDHPNAVEVELYSQDREYVWPGNDEVYLLDDGETKTMSVECDEGESICYGAWIQGDQNTFWGVGPDNSQKCDNCCYICTGGQTEQINLVP